MIKHAFCAALLASLVAVPLRAAGTDNDQDRGPKAATESGHRRMADRMKKKLGMSDEQAKKLDAAFQGRRAAVKPLREALRKALRRVHGLLEIEASDKDIQAALSQVEQARKALRADDEKFQKILETMLTPTQRAEMLLLRERMMRRGRPGQGGHEGWRMRGAMEGRGERQGPACPEARGQDREEEGD